MDVRKAYQATQLARVRPDTRPQPVARATKTSGDASARVAISGPAGLLNRLSSLQEADETRFKHLMGAVGSNLKAAANPESGAVGAELGALADQLLKVAKTGDLASFQPAASFVSGANSTSHAIEAYRRNAPPASGPSSNVSSALDYLLSAASDELFGS